MGMIKKFEIRSLLDAGVFNAGSPELWTCRFCDGSSSDKLNYRLIRNAEGWPLAIFLTYPIFGSVQRRMISYYVGLSTSLDRHDDPSFRFDCPITIENRPCNKKTSELLMLPSAPYFACQHCYSTLQRGQSTLLGYYNKSINNIVGVKKFFIPTNSTKGSGDLAQGQACNKCGHWIIGEYCPSCGSRTGGKIIQNHFKTLELEPSFNISDNNLRMAYRQKVAEYHPDRTATLGKKLRFLAEEEMKRINEAYVVLKDEHLRRIHFAEVSSMNQSIGYN